MSKLALLGGSPIRTQPLPRARSVGPEERAAALRVLDSGVLSQFLGEPHPDFFGGPEVRALEEEFAAAFGVPHGVSTNSATTALETAVAACGIGPGDEVIVTPYTMSASATAILKQSAIPVFADIHPRTYCLDPRSVRERITPQTRAIMAVDIFGQPAHWDELRAIAREHGLKIIEDAAQAAGATYRGARAGTLGDIGVLSLNYHKIIHSGEGGILLMRDQDLCRRSQLIRNHGEVVTEAFGIEDISGIVGTNIRMPELSAAVGREQLKKLPTLYERRSRLGDLLTTKLSGLEGVEPPVLDEGATSTYYGYPIRLDPTTLRVGRATFARALAAEGVPVGEGYVLPIYLQPLYQRRIAFGRDGHPWTCGHYKGTVSYERGLCPVAERMKFRELVIADIGAPPQTEEDIADVARAFEKIVEEQDALCGWERSIAVGEPARDGARTGRG